jgi:hypothetical protein
MPWQREEFHQLSPQEIEKAPVDSGIFGLFKPGAWVYIASTKNIRQALLYYMDGNMPWVSQQQPQQFAFEIVDRRRRALRCSELTTEYRPVFLNCV